MDCLDIYTDAAYSEDMENEAITRRNEGNETMTTTTTRDWDKVWVVTHDGRMAWKWSNPKHTVYMGGPGEISTDIWMDKMEAKGFDLIDGRGQPAGNVWE